MTRRDLRIWLFSLVLLFLNAPAMILFLAYKSITTTVICIIVVFASCILFTKTENSVRLPEGLSAGQILLLLSGFAPCGCRIKSTAKILSFFSDKNSSNQILKRNIIRMTC